MAEASLTPVSQPTAGMAHGRLRAPAVEIVISTQAVGEGTVTDVLTQFSPDLNLVPAERQCLGLTEAPQVYNDSETT